MDECRSAVHTLLEASTLMFLGLQLDSLKLEIRLPDRKLAELRELIGQFQGKRSMTRKDLESLVGKLAFASHVVKPGKTFMRRMFQLLSGIRQDHHDVHLNKEFQ